MLIQSANRSFWRAAARLPDQAYEWFQQEDCWVVSDPSRKPVVKPVPETDFVGPFSLYVPSLGGRKIVVFGAASEIEQSQARFLDLHRDAIGKLTPRPIASALALLYPVVAGFHAFLDTPAGAVASMGHALANLGYLMLAAGLFAGTFRVFGLSKRRSVLMGALAAWIGGVVLSNFSS